MEKQNEKDQRPKKGFKAWLQKLFAGIPLIGWLFSVFGAVLIEYFLGDLISYYLGLPKIPGNLPTSWLPFWIRVQFPSGPSYILAFSMAQCTFGLI
jgi:hypothetical protein